MKGSRRQPAAASQQQPAAPASPTTKGTAKYTNKDGSKFITVPKVASSTADQLSPTAASMPSPSPASAPAPGADEAAPPVNRKKAKRRAKAAAKAAAEADLTRSIVNGLPSPAASGSHGSKPSIPEPEYSDDDHAHYPNHQTHGNGHAPPLASKSRKKKGKKGDGSVASAMSSSRHPASAHSHSAAGDHGPPPLEHSLSRASGISKEKIWNTSSQEERQRIKEFWLGLGEDERKSLVKVEKDAVLKKMKEQQKHTCSCTVCGRKRTAIEEELEGLYDAYYEELESFANQPNHNGEAPPMLGPSRHFASTGGYTSQVMPSSYPPQQPSRGRIVEHVGDDEEEEGDDDYSEDEEDEEDDEEEEEENEYSDEEEPEEIHRDHPTEHQTDFFNFGNSLTVQGGILTVADDLLKNDGKKFIEMMEQLAERRMAREEDAKDQYSGNYPHAVNGANYPAHSHPPPPEDEEEYEEDEEEEEYDSQEDEYDEEEVQIQNPAAADTYYDHCEHHCPHHCPHHGTECCHTDGGALDAAGQPWLDASGRESQAKQPCHAQDTMTEEQRMEEGRRMFQIFAARMFEQRVLTAYREKVARERQEKLLEELAEESREADQRKAKKAKEAQKRKDKLQQKKQALAEEKARKDAERAAEEAERLAEEQRKAEEQRQKAEERRRKKEAQKKAEEEDRLRKEAERLRRQNELKERQAEQERKAREAKEKEKKAKEEAKQKEKAAREQKEREARERKEKQERERQDREAKAKAEKEAKEKQRREERAAQKAATLANAPVPITLVKRPSQQQPSAALPVLPQNPPASVASPQIPVATPVIPKLPTPARPRQASQQDPNTAPSGPAPSMHGAYAQSMVTGQNTMPEATTPVHMSPAPLAQLGRVGNHGASPLDTATRLASMQQQQQSPHQPNYLQQQQPPLPPPHGMGFGAPLSLFGGTGPMIPPPGFGGRLGHDNMFPTAMGAERFRTPSSPGPPGLGMPIPSMNGHPGRGGFGPMPPPPGFAQTPELATIGTYGSLPKDSPIGLQSHSRHASSGFDSPAPPISRPAPIGHPGSVVQGHRGSLSAAGDDEEGGDLSDPPHLGSSALIDDEDEPLPEFNSLPRRGVAPGPRGFPPVAPGPFGMDPTGAFGSPLWSHPGPSHLASPGGLFGHTAPPPGFGSMAPLPSAMPWGTSPTYVAPGLARPQANRSVQIRLLLCRACQELSELRSKASTPDRSGGSKTRTPDPEKGYNSLQDIKAQIDIINPGDIVTVAELLDLCDTEGNQANGGGSFETRQDDATNQVHVRWLPTDSDQVTQRAVGRSLGEIGSPIIGGGSGSSNSPWGTPVGGR
ncbi:hypothetical protein RB593_006127 [Gaeumannomyces tritici]